MNVETYERLPTELSSLPLGQCPRVQKTFGERESASAPSPRPAHLVLTSNAVAFITASTTPVIS
jgi:hypothetical protein